MVNIPTKWLGLCGGVLLTAATAAFAQDSSALIDVLVRKGIITDQEAIDIKTDLQRDAGATPAGKINLGSTTTEFRIAGDIRARYEERSGENDLGDHQERGRFRYRFRLGFTGKLQNDFFYGVRLESATGSRSANVTMGDDAGPWAKNSDALNIGQAYIGWTPNSNWTLMVGRMPNPLVTTSMVWDADINPEGVSEQWKLHNGTNDYFANFGQFLYGTAGSQNVFGSTPTNKDVYLFAWQGGAKFGLSNGQSIQVAPTIYNYVNTDQSKNPSPFKGTFSAANMTGINNLFVLEIPAEYGFKIGDIASKVFGDFAYNFEGKDRARKWGRADLDGENYGWQLGFQYGKAVNKGEWDAKVFYQSVGAFAIDTNLVDSDLFDSRTNMEGWVIGGNYAIGNATQVGLTVAKGQRKDGSIVAPGSGDIGTGALNDYWLGQLDLNVKF